MRKYLLFYVLLFVSIGDLLAQYPLAPQNSQALVAGTVGERRGGGTRYHYGMDFPAAAGTNALAIEAGEYANVNGTSSLGVGRFGYIHVNVSATLIAMGEGTQVAQGTVIGTVQDIDRDHIHLQEAEDGSIYELGLTAWEAADTWVNPILSLVGFVDDGDPEIDEVNIYRQGDAGDELTDDATLFGKIDIKFDGEDPGIDTDGSTTTNNLAPLRAYFTLMDEDDEEIFEHEGINMREVPPNASANEVLADDATMSEWRVWLTHDPFNTPYERYFSTRQKPGEDVMYDSVADLPTTTDLEGQCVYFEITSEDTQNETTSRLPEEDDDYYIIDNFKPYVRTAGLFQDNDLIYTLTRTGSEGTGEENDGSVTNAYTEEPALSGTDADLAITVIMSEPMLEVDLIFTGIFFPLESLDDDGLEWGINLGSVFIPENECYNIDIFGLDKNSNDLVDIRTGTGGNQINNPLLIPVRNDEGDWINDPDGFIGDGFDFCFVDCQQRQEQRMEMISCEELNNLVPVITHPSCREAFGAVTFNTSDTPDAVLWTDESGNVIGTELTLSDLEPGTYCFDIVAECCNRAGCVTLIEGGLPEYNYQLSDNGTSADFKDLTGSMNVPDGGALPVVVRTIDQATNTVLCNSLLSSGSSFFSCAFLGVGSTYCLEFTDANDCVFIECFTVEGQTCDEIFPITLQDFRPTCPDEETGYLELAVGTQGCTPETIVWSTGQQGMSIDGLAAGEYCVTVTGDEGSFDCSDCISVSCFTIGTFSDDSQECNPDCAPFSVDQLKVTPICRNVWWEWDYLKYTSYFFRAGAVNIQLSGGQPPYTIVWQDGNPSGFDRLFMQTGTYEALIMDECGFEVTISFLMTINWTSNGCDTDDVSFLVGGVHDELVEFANQQLSRSVEEISSQETVRLGRYYVMTMVDSDHESVSYGIFSSENRGQIVGTYEIRLTKDDRGRLGTGSTSLDVAPEVSDKVLSAYPNPFSELLTIIYQSDRSERIITRLTNLTGRVVWQRDYDISSGRNALKLEFRTEMPRGVYFLQIIDEAKQSSVIKLYKER